METLDALSPEEMQSEHGQQKIDISLLKLLYIDNPLKRKLPNRNLAYAWLALSIAEKHKLQNPLWVVTVLRREASNSARISEYCGVNVAAAKVKQADTDRRILLAISDYQKAIVKPVEVHLIQKQKPTIQEFEEATSQKRKRLWLELQQLNQLKKRTPAQIARLATLRDQFKPLDDEKLLIAKRIAKQHGISHQVLMKNYYQISQPKKKGAKKQPEFSLHTWLPAPFTDLPF